jgi:dihydropteroate synthase
MSALSWADLLPRKRAAVMGILNVTPDSFSDGGRFLSLEAALAQAEAMVAAGADIIDVGGESTRPGSEPVSALDEAERVLPIIHALRASLSVPISIDTLKPAVAGAAIEAGAHIWNDVSGFGTPEAVERAARLGRPVVVMHMQGQPKTMQSDPRYEDVVDDVVSFLQLRVRLLARAGLSREAIAVDPGIGFGKTLEHNLALLRATGEIGRRTGCAVLVGASRKRFIAAIDPRRPAEHQRLGGSLATALYAVSMGARIIRVHDVAETVQALQVQAALENTLA